jgi:hypothetical protein
LRSSRAGASTRGPQTFREKEKGCAAHALARTDARRQCQCARVVLLGLLHTRAPFRGGPRTEAEPSEKLTTTATTQEVPKRKTFCVSSGSRLEVEVSTLLVRPPALAALRQPASQPSYSLPTNQSPSRPLPPRPHFLPPIKQMPFVVSSYCNMRTRAQKYYDLLPS